MSAPPLPELLEALEATWPPERRWRQGPWTLRQGGRGGKRVSAATAEARPLPADIDAAEVAMRELGQTPLFRLTASRENDALLDAELGRRGYRTVDPTLILAAPAANVSPAPLPPMRAFDIWPPLAIQRDVWAAGGIGFERQAVMERVASARTALMARQADRLAAAGFVALHGRVAMLHAVHVVPALRRQGVARNLAFAAAEWAVSQGAEWLALAVTEENSAARALYDSVGTKVAGRYYYRVHPEEKPDDRSQNGNLARRS